MGRKKLWSDLVKILHWGDILNTITCAKFGDDRLRGFSVARGQILGFSIGFRRRPYNTLMRVCDVHCNSQTLRCHSCVPCGVA